MQNIQKSMRIMAIVAASLIALSVLLLLITIPIQESQIDASGYISKDVYFDILPIFPTIPFIFTCLYLVCAVALLFACYGKTDRIAIEIIVFICLLIIPLIHYYAMIYSRFLAQGDSDYFSTYSMLTLIFDNYTMFSRWAQPLCLVVCGMSAVVKRMRGKATTQADNSPVLSENL